MLQLMVWLHFPTWIKWSILHIDHMRISLDTFVSTLRNLKSDAEWDASTLMACVWQWAATTCPSYLLKGARSRQTLFEYATGEKQNTSLLVNSTHSGTSSGANNAKQLGPKWQTNHLCLQISPILQSKPSHSLEAVKLVQNIKELNPLGCGTASLGKQFLTCKKTAMQTSSGSSSINLLQ
jgi:hypothetical protein